MQEEIDKLLLTITGYHHVYVLNDDVKALIHVITNELLRVVVVYFDDSYIFYNGNGNTTCVCNRYTKATVNTLSDLHWRRLYDHLLYYIKNKDVQMYITNDYLSCSASWLILDNKK